jgi:hypothetical protein
MALEEEKLMLQQVKEEALLRSKQQQDSRAQLIEDLQLEKARLISREAQLGGRVHECEARASEL